MKQLSLRSLSLRRGKQSILNDIEADLTLGQFVGVVGPNGAGKSHLLQALAGLLPFQGEVMLDSTPLRQMSVRERSQCISWLAQDPSCEFGYRVEDVVMMGRHAQHRGSPAPDDRRSIQLEMNFWEITHLRHKSVHAISQGELQKVFLAQTFASQNPVILLDEPDNNLDIRNKLRVYEKIRQKVQQGHLVVAVMHDINDVMNLADSLLGIKQGCLSIPLKKTADVKAAELSELFEVRASFAQNQAGKVHVDFAIRTN